MPPADKKPKIKLLDPNWSHQTHPTGPTLYLSLNHLNVSQHPSIRARRAARELSQGAPPEKVRMSSVMSVMSGLLGGSRIKFKTWNFPHSDIPIITTVEFWYRFLRSDICKWFSLSDMGNIPLDVFFFVCPQSMGRNLQFSKSSLRSEQCHLLSPKKGKCSKGMRATPKLPLLQKFWRLVKDYKLYPDGTEQWLESRVVRDMRRSWSWKSFFSFFFSFWWFQSVSETWSRSRSLPVKYLQYKFDIIWWVETTR